MTQPTSPESVIQPHLQRLLEARESPKTICPSEVARAFSATELNCLKASNWRELMPTIRAMLWAMRNHGEVKILQKGSLLPPDMKLEDVKGPIRARKVANG